MDYFSKFRVHRVESHRKMILLGIFGLISTDNHSNLNDVITMREKFDTMTFLTGCHPLGLRGGAQMGSKWLQKSFLLKGNSHMIYTYDLENCNGDKSSLYKSDPFGQNWGHAQWPRLNLVIMHIQQYKFCCEIITALIYVFKCQYPSGGDSSLYKSHPWGQKWGHTHWANVNIICTSTYSVLKSEYIWICGTVLRWPLRPMGLLLIDRTVSWIYYLYHL